MKHKIIGYFSIFLGISVISIWIMILLHGDIPEGKTELSFHLFSEFLMAFICILSGILMLIKHHLANRLNILGFGMIIYSVLNAAGYYGERDVILMVILFSLLLILSVSALLVQVFNKD